MPRQRPSEPYRKKDKVPVEKKTRPKKEFPAPPPQTEEGLFETSFN